MSDNYAGTSLPEETNFILSSDYAMLANIGSLQLTKMTEMFDILSVYQTGSAAAQVGKVAFVLSGASIVLAVVDVFLGLGIPYAQAAQEAHNRRLRNGFAIGFCAGLFEHKWPYVKSTFVYRVPVTGMVKTAAAKGYAEGVITGFVASRRLSPKAREGLRTVLTMQLDDFAKGRVQSCGWHSFILHYARAFETNYIR